MFKKEIVEKASATETQLTEKQLYLIVDLVRFLVKNPNATYPYVDENGARLIKVYTTYDLLKKFGLI